MSLLTPSEVAEIFGVDPKTVTRWAKAGRIPAIRTPGGHRRYDEAKILAIRDKTATPIIRTTPTTGGTDE